MRKYLNYIIFAAVVAVVIFLAVSHSMHVRSLVADMASGDAQRERAAAAELIQNEQFMDAISGEPTRTREAAAGALEALGNKDAVKQLIAFLKDPDKPVRDKVTTVLEHIGANSPDNITELMNGLKDGDANVRKGAMTALTDPTNGIGPKPGIVPAIVKIMKAEGGARDPGGDVLGSPVFLKAGSNKESVPLLIALMSDKDEGVRTGAISALGKIGDPTAVPDLKKAMGADTAQVRRVAISAIAHIADPSGEDALTEAIRNPSDDSQARVEAAVGLGKIATPTAIATLIAALNDDDLNLRAGSVSALARAARPTPDAPVNARVVSALTTAISSGSDAAKLGAAQALQTAAAPEANGVLIAALQNGTPILRAAAATALGYAGNSAAITPLIKGLSDPIGDVATASREALGSIGSAAIEPLISQLAHGGAEGYYAAEALGATGSSALPALQKAADSSNPVEQRFVAVALGDLNSPDAKPTLQKLAASSDPDVAYAAKQQLDMSGAVE